MASRVGQTQTVITIAPFYAILIAITVLLLGVLIGVWAGWFLTGQDLKRAKQENLKLRSNWDSSKSNLDQLNRERDTALRELKEERERIELIDAQLKSRQRLLDQTNDYLQSTEQQLTTAHAHLKQQRLITEELRVRLNEVEQLAMDRHTEIADLQRELQALRRRVSEVDEVMR